MATFTGINPFFITHKYNTPLLNYNIAAANGMENRGARTPAEIGNKITRKLREASDFAQAVIAYVQDIQQQYVNQYHQPTKRLRVRNHVWLNLKNITIDKPYKKLNSKNTKYTVLKIISNHNYRLDTPPGIHDVFHANLLKHAAADPFPNQRQDDLRPPVIIMDGEEKWEVERILKERVRDRQR